MHYRYLFIFIISISLNIHAFEPKIEIFEQFDNLKMVAFISQEDMRNNPDWNPNVEAPPLTISGAIKAVKNFSKKLNPIKEIELRSMMDYKNKWHYLIKSSDDSKNSKYDIYVVLMSGKVIPGIIEPQGYK